jgi:putative FmdB family regulatory protein
MRVLEEYQCSACGCIFEEIIEKERRDDILECPSCGKKTAGRVRIRKSTKAMKSTWRP